MSNEPILDVKNLRVRFHTDEGTLQAVNGVSFTVNQDEIVGVVGESGAGKSVTWEATLQLINDPAADIQADRLTFKGTDLLDCSASQLRQIRGNDIGVIFQDPMSALNPTRTVGVQIAEMFTTHRGLSKTEARTRAIEMMEDVSIPEAEDRYHNYPHEFSGGMKQRVMIAIALACDPSLVIADEPTTALDVTTQAQILNLLNQKQNEYNLSMLFITHDMGVIWETSQRVLVMYAGKVVEEAPTEALFDEPAHPYTKKLLESIPPLHDHREYLRTIEGTMPEFYDTVPTGCSFCSRCDEKMEECETSDPESYNVGVDHSARCFLYD